MGISDIFGQSFLILILYVFTSTCGTCGMHGTCIFSTESKVLACMHVTILKYVFTRKFFFTVFSPDCVLQTDEMMRCMRAQEASILSYAAVAERFEANLHNGLTPYEAQQRHKVHGYNEFDISEEVPLWKKYLGQVSKVK